MMDAQPELDAARSPLDRLADAIRSLDDQIEDVRGRMDARIREVRERVTSEVANRREQLQRSLEDTDLYRRAQDAGRQLEQQLGEVRGQVLNRLGLVSKSEVERLESRLEEIAGRLRELGQPPQQPPI